MLSETEDKVELCVNWDDKRRLQKDETDTTAQGLRFGTLNTVIQALMRCKLETEWRAM